MIAANNTTAEDQLIDIRDDIETLSIFLRNKKKRADMAVENLNYVASKFMEVAPDRSAETVTFYTDGSAKPSRGKGGWGLYGTDSNGNEYSGWGFAGHMVTNNRAELLAYINVLEMALISQWKSITVYIDSEYVLHGSKTGIRVWPKQNWTTAAGKPVINLDEWKRIQDLQTKLAENGVSIERHWVKGHSDVFGNEQADQNAKRGRLACEKGDDQFVLNCVKLEPKAEVKETEVVEEESGKTKKKTKKSIPSCNRLIAGKRLVFTTNSDLRTEDGYHIYMITSFKDSAEDRGMFLGKIVSDDLNGVVLTKEPVKQIETVIDYQHEITPNDYDQPAMLYLDKVRSPKTWSALTEFGNKHLDNKHLNVLDVEKDPLTLFLRPPFRAYHALNFLTGLLTRLNRYRLNQEHRNEEYIDITEHLYTPQKKGYKFNASAITDNSSIVVPISHEGNVVQTTLTLNIDLPPKNNLTSLVKETESLKVLLVKFNSTPESFRYSVIIETDSDYAIYSTSSANLKPV